ncbi:hypothetical protein TREMEDRAFT_57164, partial [Tremella mesenterica DSM 1558]|uniref:uncharacterized protein n=1 Tax=Tremella mesenterica (strain ATCC 24925 / CBS 8224 / DSM 1558 / NBRC 9311 / NRRL Y-6157 / RJB 2259-6 / UBC 559-6) TaxID=578456 RepID=UPI0003F49D8A
MDDSMSSESPAGPSRPTPFPPYQTPTTAVGLGLNPPQPFPTSFPSPGPVHVQPMQGDPWAIHRIPPEPPTSPIPAEEQHGEQVGEEGEGAEEEEEEAMSEGSSAEYDPETNPEEWANRLDELAGVLEVGEEEARAIRWGPALGQDRNVPDLPLEEFKALINHHLTTTEWRYTPNPTMSF